MNPALIKIYIYQILRGLMYMSFEDIAHRDMKPHNVLVNPVTNKTVVCDFGSAKQLVKGNFYDTQVNRTLRISVRDVTEHLS
jgi:serine/threonine protein kinase